MVSFIKKIILHTIDDEAHRQLVRFGKGIYPGRAILNFWKTGKIKLSGSSEHVNDFVLFAAELGCQFSGVIMAREPIDGMQGKKKSGLIEYPFSGNSDQLREIAPKAYALLLDCSGEITLKSKKKLPKPGKSGEGKIDDKFCILEVGLEHEGKVKDWFFWDAQGKKIKVIHEYHISDIILPKGISDPVQLRLNAKRKGKLIRKLYIEGKESIQEVHFEG